MNNVIILTSILNINNIYLFLQFYFKYIIYFFLIIINNY